MVPGGVAWRGGFFTCVHGRTVCAMHAAIWLAGDYGDSAPYPAYHTRHVCNHDTCARHCIVSILSKFVRMNTTRNAGSEQTANSRLIRADVECRVHVSQCNAEVELPGKLAVRCCDTVAMAAGRAAPQTL